MMKGDLHYEVVVDPAGKAHRLYFTDAVRDELPASIASAVALTIHRPKEVDERVTMTIDESGESWIGSGRPVVMKGAGVGVAFTMQGEPYSIDLPLAPAPKTE